MATAWVLNLDADLELAFGSGYEVGERVLRVMAPHVERARGLLATGDVVVGPRAHARGYAGRAWCPTPSAVRRLLAAGAVPEPHPAFEVLRWVNSRAFCASLGQTLPGAVFANELDAAIDAIDAIAANGAARLKRNFGMAGRGHRVVERIDEGVLSFLRAGMREGGVQIEPNLRIEAEYALHGYLEPDGALRVGHLVLQRCDAHGQWLSSELATGPEIDLQRVARELHRAGYFGPFGVDTYVHAGGYQPLSEINARYSMGYAVGFSAAERS